MLCQRPNLGNVVSAHSNQSRDGKGKSIKASDAAIAFLCESCHTETDQGSKLSRADRIDLWETAHRATMRWLIESGGLIVNGKGP